MRILMVGDVVGRPGVDLLVRKLAEVRQSERLDFVIANAENAANGSGLTPSLYAELIRAGVDCITLGDHIYRRREIKSVLRRETNIVKPANFPASAPGLPWTMVQSRTGVPVAVFCLLGRQFMRPVDCPWAAADRVLEEIPADVRVIFVDFHAEATSDMQLMGRYLDGRVTAVLGTHTHVPTADECILPGGTAFQCDVGMTGPHDGILGRQYEPVLVATLSFWPKNFDVSRGDVRLHGTIVDVDPQTGRATGIQRLVVRG